MPEAEDQDPVTLMAKRGAAKYAAKRASMVANYQAARRRAVENYRATGFGPSMTRSYEAGLSIGKTAYTEAALDEKRWSARWLAKAREGLPEAAPQTPPPPTAPPAPTQPAAPAAPPTKGRKISKSEFHTLVDTANGTSGTDSEDSEQESHAETEGPT